MNTQPAPRIWWHTLVPAVEFQPSIHSPDFRQQHRDTPTIAKPLLPLMKSLGVVHWLARALEIGNFILSGIDGG